MKTPHGPDGRPGAADDGRPRDPAPQADENWEQALAPRVPAPYLWGVAALFVLWVGFLAAMSIHRWVLTLQ